MYGLCACEAFYYTLLCSLCELGDVVQRVRVREGKGERERESEKERGEGFCEKSGNREKERHGQYVYERGRERLTEGL